LKRLVALAPWYAACLGMGLTLWLFYPGFMSWDSAYQWWQVRHGVFDPAHPVIMVIIWRFTNMFLPGPGGYFIFQTTLYWLSLALFVSALNFKPWLKVLMVLSLGFWPSLWGLSLHLWKDIGAMSFFCLAAAFLAYDYRKASFFFRLSALLGVVLACTYRYNALSAGTIFLAYLVYREVSLNFRNFIPRKKIIAGGSVLLIAGVQLILMLPNYVLKLKDEPLWPLQAQWDIAAVSVRENQLLFPPGWTSPKLTLEVLKQDFNPSVNVPVFKNSLLYLNPYYPMSENDFTVLRKAWLRLPIDHPKAYWHHRWYVTKNLFGMQQDERYPNFVFAPGMVQYKDNPIVAPVQKKLAAVVQDKLLSMTESVFFYGWCYALLALIVFLGAALKKNMLAAMLSLSALCYTLPLVILAPSCDFRYLSWLLLGSLLALLTTLSKPADKPFKQ
jgi:hypothetical protein